VSGCLERADQTQSSAATTTVDSLSFVLIRAAATRPTGTSGSTEIGTGTAIARDRLYRLDGPVEALNQHVGQHVEVTGTVAEASTAPAGAGSSTNVSRLNVESIRTLDTTCPR
jgi:hypothetical protein